MYIMITGKELEKNTAPLTAVIRQSGQTGLQKIKTNIESAALPL